MRQGDLVFRKGGEEFFVLMPDVHERLTLDVRTAASDDDHETNKLDAHHTRKRR